MYQFFDVRGGNEKIIFEKIGSKKTHNNYVYGLVVFPPPVNRLVSASWDSTFKIWDISDGLLLFEKNPGLGALQDAIIWRQLDGKETKFVICGTNGVKSFSVLEPHFRQIKEFRGVMENNKYPSNIHQITYDSFIISFFSRLCMISYSKEKILKTSINSKNYTDPEFCSSLLHPEEYFFGCSMTGSFGETHMFGIEGLKILKTFKRPRFEDKILSVATFINKLGNEILVSGGYDKTLHFFNTNCLDQKKAFLREVQLNSIIYTSVCLGNDFIAVGDTFGYYFIIDLQNYTKIGETKIHDEGIWVMKFIPNYNGKKDQVTIASCSFDKQVNIVQLKGLRCELKTFQEKLDLKERVAFLSNEIEFYSCEYLEKMDVVLENITIENVLKILLL